MSEEINKTPTSQSFEAYRKGLEPEINKAKTDMKVARTGYREAVRSRQFKRFVFRKAEVALAEYEGLLNGVVSFAQQDTVEIDNNVKNYVTQSATVKTAFTDVINALKAAKKALYDVELTASAVAELVENSEQSEENKWLRTHINGFGHTIKEIAGDLKARKRGLADQSNDLADDAFEVAVKVVGINASVHIESLPPLSTSLKDSLTALKGDVDGNITFNLGEKQKAQVELTKQNQAQSTGRATISRARLLFAGLKNMEAFAHKPHCPDSEHLAKETRTKLNELSDKVEQTYA